MTTANTTRKVPSIVTKVAGLDLSGPVRPIGHDKANRERKIETYRQIRESAVEDIRNATLGKVDSQWMADRVRDINWANRQLVRLGALPAMA